MVELWVGHSDMQRADMLVELLVAQRVVVKVAHSVENWVYSMDVLKVSV